MKCPYCDVEMLSGYLSTGSIIWSDSVHLFNTIPSRKEKYALRLGALLGPHNIKSDCCPQCKRIIIDASNYKNNL